MKRRVNSKRHMYEDLLDTMADMGLFDIEAGIEAGMEALWLRADDLIRNTYKGEYLRWKI